MHYLSLQQPYQEYVNLECLLRDAPRRLQQARESGMLTAPENLKVSLVGAGFSAVLAAHALGARLSAVHDPSGALPRDIFPDTPLKSLDDLAKTGGERIVLLAAAPRKAEEMMRRIDALAGPGAHKVLLFSPDDARDEVEAADANGWLRLNMSYRCVNFAVNLSRRYRPIPPISLDGPAATAIMGRGLAGLLARMALLMAGSDFAGFAEPAGESPGNGALAADCDLLVTYAPHTFAGREAAMCAGLSCRSAQFLFREADATMPAAERDGYGGLRLLGAGEEGMVFQAVSPKGEPCCYKAYFEPRDRSDLMAWTASLADAAPGLGWMGRVRGVPDARALRGVVQPYVELAHVPFMDEGRDDVLRALAAHCLQVQMEHVARGRVPATMPGGIHAMCERSGALRFVDVGNLPPRIEESSPEDLKAAVVKGLAGLAHETLFCGASWRALDPSGYSQAVAKRLEQGGTGLPGWYPGLLREVLGLDAGRFADPAAFRDLQERHGLSRAALPEEVAARAHAPAEGVAPAPRMREGDKDWFRECQYQTFLYRPGEVKGFGRTGEKYALVRESFEREVAGASYMDIGSNQGFFLARAALAGASRCTGIEKLPELQVQSRRMLAAAGLKNVAVQGIKLANGHPLPEHDVVSAFAIIHHLYLVDGTFARLGDLVDLLAQAAQTRAVYLASRH